MTCDESDSVVATTPLVCGYLAGVVMDAEGDLVAFRLDVPAMVLAVAVEFLYE